MVTETAHSLAGHPGLCKHVHGHSYKWTVEVGSPTLTDDMVMDFTHLKVLMDMVIGPYDHAHVVDKQTWENAAPNITDERLIIYSHRPTAERMAASVYAELRESLPEHVTLVRVICRETKNNEACYGESV